MTGTTYVDKLTVTESLRARELHDRADWVDRQFPALIDTAKNAALLRTLGIDLEVAASSVPAGDEVAEETPASAAGQPTPTGG
jgi:hypothetical protein